MTLKNRNTIIRAALLVMLALIICLVSGCSQNNEPAPAAATPEAAAAPAAESTEAPAEEELAEAALAEEASDTAAEAVAPAEPVLLVTVNGKEIRSDDDYLNAIISEYTSEAEEYEWDTTSPDVINLINQYSLKYAIHSTLLHQKATELGLDQLSDEDKAAVEADAKAQWEELIENYSAQYGLITSDSTEEDKVAARAQAEAYFQTFGYDEERFVRDSLDGKLETVMAERLMDHLTEGRTVSDEDVLEYFNDLVSEDREYYGNSIDMYEYYTNYFGQSSYYIPEGYRGIIHILLDVDEQLLNNWKDLSARLEEQQSDAESEATDAATPTDLESAETAAPEATPAPTDEPVTQEMVDAAAKAILDSVQPTVDEINAKLAAGASFEDLIKEYGKDPGMEDDATRAEGYHVHKDSIMWDPAFTEAAMKLEKIGDVSGPVLGQYGVHILQYLKDIPGGAKELTEEMKDEFRATLLEEIRTEALNDAIEQWEKEADIVYTAEGESWKLEEDEEEETDELPDAEAAEEPAEEAAAEPAVEETPNP